MYDPDYEGGVFTQENPVALDSKASTDRSGPNKRSKKSAPAKIGISPDGIPFFIDRMSGDRVRKKRKKKKRKKKSETVAGSNCCH